MVRKIRVCVASANPVKIIAAQDAFRHYFPTASFAAVTVNSRVGPQPRQEEVLRGALNRARAARASHRHFDFYVGIEGGVFLSGNRTFLCAAAAVMNRSGRRYVGLGPMFELPRRVMSLLRRYGELGDVIDYLTRRSGVKTREGAIGVYSKGKITRRDALSAAVTCALIPFVNAREYASTAR